MSDRFIDLSERRGTRTTDGIPVLTIEATDHLTTSRHEPISANYILDEMVPGEHYSAKNTYLSNIDDKINLDKLLFERAFNNVEVVNKKTEARFKLKQPFHTYRQQQLNSTTKPLKFETR